MNEAGGGIEIADVQGLAFYAYSEHPCAKYLLIQFVKGDPRTGAWLRGLAASSERTMRPRHAEDASNRMARTHADETVHVAFTASGLAAFGLSDADLAQFPREFTQGMADPERSRVLGDDPSDWAFGGPQHEEIHAVLMLFARTDRGLARLVAQHEQELQSAGASVLRRDEGRLFPDNHEHFGFHDGISQPIVAGGPRRPRPREATVPPGELLLGYVDAYGEMTPSPKLGIFDIGRNGTFVVYRTLRQNVSAFWTAMYERARPRSGESIDDAAVRLAASLVGRWPGGAPLAVHPDRDVASDGRRNDFAYAREDPSGFKCPFGAHIRRANPRDMLPPSPKESLVEVGRHRLFRRGRPYGPPLATPRSSWRIDDGIERGLVFIALCSSLRRHFEFIQQTWVQSPKFAGLYDERDPVIGMSPDDPRRFTSQAQPLRRCLVGLPSFVAVQGGAYFFMPGLRALARLAEAATAAAQSNPGALIAKQLSTFLTA
jgi:Dyp-type peroxidase family